MHVSRMLIHHHTDLRAVDPNDDTSTTIVAIGRRRIYDAHALAHDDGGCRAGFPPDTSPGMLIVVHDQAPLCALALGWRQLVLEKKPDPIWARIAFEREV